MKFSMIEPKKQWPFNKGDCLIEVTTWSRLGVGVLFFNNAAHPVISKG